MTISKLTLKVKLIACSDLLLLLFEIFFFFVYLYSKYARCVTDINNIRIKLNEMSFQQILIKMFHLLIKLETVG